MPGTPLNKLFLCGFMGAGKTTVGPLIAKRLGWSFLDTDDVIVKLSGKTIPELFENEGEPVFRDWERKAVLEANQQTNTVIALGGGAMGDASNRDLILKSGLLVYLNAPVATLVVRLTATDRPLLKTDQGVDLARKISTLFLSREPYYKLAHITVDTDDRTTEAIADEVASEVKAWKP